MKRLIINNDRLTASGPRPLSMPEPSVRGSGQSFSLPTVPAVSPRILQPIELTHLTDDFMTQKTSFSSSELLAGNTTSKVLVNAPGAGKIATPICFVLKYTYGTVTYTTNVQAQAHYLGSGINFLASTIIGSTETTILRQNVTGGLSWTPGGFDPVNKDIVLDIATGNPAAGDGTLDVYTVYVVVEL